MVNDRIRAYYAHALDQTRNTQSSVWSDNPVMPPSEAGIGVPKFLAAGAGLFAAGYIKTSQGRVWDKYLSGIRAFEEYFFAKIPRTLQLSNIFSQFETAARVPRYIQPRQLGQYSSLQLEYLEKLTGVSQSVLSKHGLRFENQKLYLGVIGNNVLLERANIIRNLNRSPHYSSSYARSLGVDLRAGGVFEESLPFVDQFGKEQSEVFQIIGGKNRVQSASRQLSGIGTELVERVNRLAKSPVDFPIIGPLLRKLPIQLGVKPGGGVETFARLTAKLGILGGGAYLGYQTLDYAARNASILDNTTFDQGLSAGFANIWAQSNLAYAKLGELTDWTESARKQEAYAPGSTSLQHLLAFPITGAVAGGLYHYIQRTALMLRLQTQRGRDVTTASDVATKFFSKFRGSGITASIGRHLRESKSLIIRSVAKSPMSIKAAVGAVLGTIPILPFLVNAFAPAHTEEELRRIYVGETEEPVRRGRWWSLGRTPYEGENIEYFRKHWVARINERAKEKAIWEPLEHIYGGEISPFKQWWIQNFTYQLEQAHYYDRPYPVTGTAFKNIPLIGPVLAATLGRMIKPPAFMHQEEYTADSKYKFLPPGFGLTRAPELGEQLPAIPIAPTELSAVAGEQMFRMTQFSGLPGFLLGTIKQSVTGSQNFFDQESQLASADEIYSASRGFYDESLGDMYMSNELLRRMIPRERNIDQYNPIRNTMPSWLPGPGERGPNLLYGDPYAAIPLGEERLPGPGYAASHPELASVDPADYPAIWQYKILADVAPYTTQFDEAAKRVSILHKQNRLTDQEEEIYWTVQKQLKARKEKKVFNEYKYREQELNPVQEALAEWNRAQSEDTGPGWFHRTLGSYWETISHHMESPLEQLTPVSPVAKLLHQRSAIEDYERTQVWGTTSAFWNRPIENFIKPTVTSFLHDIGWNNIPADLEKRRKLEEHFDILKYIKFTRLRGLAEEARDPEAYAEFEQKRRETLFGVNPYTYDYTEIFRALPRRERDYFNAFVETKDIEERTKILSMIPDNERGLYLARWQQEDAKDFQKATKLGLLSQDEIDRGLARVKEMYEDIETEGLPKSQDLWQEYISTRLRGESYPDWYRRTKLLERRIRELGVNLPGPDWVGFNPNVDLDDIKLKIVQDEGGTIQDYDLWPSRERQFRFKQAFINREAVAPIVEETPDPAQIRRNIHNLLAESNYQDIQVDVLPIAGNSSKVDIDIQEDRTAELKQRLREMRG